MRRPHIVLLLAATLAASACAPSLSSTARQGFQSFLQQDYAGAVAQFRTEEKKEDEHYVLRNLRLSSAALAAGDFWDAARALRNATQVMNSDVGQGRGVLSLVSSESIKFFKGEPFEKAMAWFYLGVHFYNAVDFENARAAFNQALLADKQSAEGYREDLRLVYFMLAKTLLKLGDSENAKLAMSKARDRRPGEPYAAIAAFDLKQAATANVTVLVELGHVPLKQRTGPGASLDTFVPVDYPERQVSLKFGDGPWYPAAKALDLAYEAAHRGSSGKDAVQAAKGVARDAALVTAAVSRKRSVQMGALLFALADQSQADIRQWELLPGEIQLISMHLPAQSGVTLTLNFSDVTGAPLPQWQQIWHYMPIDDKREHVYLFRSGKYQGWSRF